MSNSFSVSYVTRLPKIANAPSVTIKGNDLQRYRVEFCEFLDDNKTISLLSDNYCYTNQTLTSSIRQWYTKWFIRIYDEKENLVFEDTFNPLNKVIFIKIDAYALGDTIAWIPYIENFRKRHNCTVICSSFHNDILFESYPNILFIEPNIQIENVYAQYYIGAVKNNVKYSTIDSDRFPLQNVASEILGLKEHIELKPNLSNFIKHSEKLIVGDYVTLSEFGSHPEKNWRNIDGWQTIVNHLVDNGYRVVVVSKEPTTLTNVIDMSGSDLKQVSSLIYYAKFHMGVSSGLSWLAWSLGTHVVMISDYTPIFHEFLNNITRIGDLNLKQIDYSNTYVSNVNNVIEQINFLIK